MVRMEDNVELALNRIHQGDCIERMSQFPAGIADLAFADPPFNIGYDYDVYDDKKSYHAYLEWTGRWMAEVCRLLKSDGSFWIAIGDEYAAEIKLLAQNELNLHCRSWVIWYYTFGVNCTKKFTRSHAHLFHFVKDRERFTFNEDELCVPSARQLVYADSRADPAGRLPDDTWILRPQDLPESFNAEEATWFFSRVAGTFKERSGFHGCQMPEQLLGRIIRACSRPGELVLDPFAGSGTTLAVAKKLTRRWLGFELSEDYAAKAGKRLEETYEEEPLLGAPEPVVSAPKTPGNASGVWLRAGVHRALIEAFLVAGGSVTQVVEDAKLNALFAEKCCEFDLPGSPADWNRALKSLDRAGMLKKLRKERQQSAERNGVDLFTSER
jgi:DNA modification methylase